MSTIDLKLMRATLQAIEQILGPGYLISCSWDGALMHVTIGVDATKVKQWRRPWVMTLECEEDYSSNPAELINEFVAGARDWFEGCFIHRM